MLLLNNGTLVSFCAIYLVDEDRNRHRHTFGICPIGIQVRQSCLVAYLLEGLGRLVVDLEDTARSPPAGAKVVAIGHVEVGAAAPRRVVARVEGDGALQENWGRQLGGIAGGR